MSLFDLQTIILCDNVSYPSNIASMYRNASLLGVGAVICCSENKNSKFQKDCKRLSMISRNKEKNRALLLFHSNVCDILRCALVCGYHVVILEMLKDTKSLCSKEVADLLATSTKIMFVVGNEKSGVCESVLAFLETHRSQTTAVVLPSAFNAPFNVASTAIIAAYERSRQFVN
jgi:tRNA G18 (ribose-2'-O)-methylase SpoU